MEIEISYGQLKLKRNTFLGMIIIRDALKFQPLDKNTEAYKNWLLRLSN